MKPVEFKHESLFEYMKKEYLNPNRCMYLFTLSMKTTIVSQMILMGTINPVDSVRWENVATCIYVGMPGHMYA